MFRIVDKANLRSSDMVLEVGPGTGNLTVRILEKCKHCVAVEFDPRMAAELTKRVQGKCVAGPGVGSAAHTNSDLSNGNSISSSAISSRWTSPTLTCASPTPPTRSLLLFLRSSLTSNQISSPLVFKLLSQRPIFRVAILMFQREFAMRLVARAGDSLWNRLSANVQLYAKVDHVMKVGRNNFRPPPQVESSVVRICPIDPPPPVAFAEFDGLTRILFTRKNKVVRSNFQAKGIEQMLEANYKAWCAQEEKVSNFDSTGRARTDESQIIEADFDMSKMLGMVLEESGYAEARASKMDVDDFLRYVTPVLVNPLTSIPGSSRTSTSMASTLLDPGLVAVVLYSLHCHPVLAPNHVSLALDAWLMMQSIEVATSLAILHAKVSKLFLRL